MVGFPQNGCTVDGSEIRLTSRGWRLIPLFTGFYTFQVVMAGFLNHQQYDCKLFIKFHTHLLHECQCARSTSNMVSSRVCFHGFSRPQTARLEVDHNFMAACCSHFLKMQTSGRIIDSPTKSVSDHFLVDG